MEQPQQIAKRFESIILSETAWTPNELLDSIYGK